MTPGVPDTTPGPPPPEATGPRAGAAPARRAPAPETARLYAIDWQSFVAWCQASGPAPRCPPRRRRSRRFSPPRGKKSARGALGRRAAAIGDRHRQLGLASPTADPAVRAILRQTRRAATPRRPARERPTQLQRMAAACPGDLAGMRDRALLLLAAAGLGRTALVGLDAERLRFTATAVELTLPQPGPAGDRLPLVVPCGATLATCRCRRCGTGWIPPARGSARYFGKSIAGAMSSTRALAPTRSGGSWRAGRRAGFAIVARRPRDALRRQQDRRRSRCPARLAARPAAAGFPPARRGPQDAAPTQPEAGASDAPPGADAAGPPAAPVALDQGAANPPVAPALATPAASDAMGNDSPDAPLRLAHTDWMHHRLVVTGPDAALAAFRVAAAGAGVIP